MQTIDIFLRLGLFLGAVAVVLATTRAAAAGPGPARVILVGAAFAAFVEAVAIVDAAIPVSALSAVLWHFVQFAGPSAWLLLLAGVVGHFRAQRAAEGRRPDLREFLRDGLRAVGSFPGPGTGSSTPLRPLSKTAGANAPLHAGTLPRDEVPSIHRAVCDIQRITNDRIMPEALRLLRGDDPDLKCEVIGFLAQSCSPETIPMLMDALDDGDARVRRVAAGQLQRITGRDFGSDGGRWRAWWMDDRSFRRLS